MRSGFVFLPVVFSIHAIVAQQIPMSGPLEGFTFDLPTKSLRMVVGSLGAATLGNPVMARLVYGSVAPEQNYALTFEDGRCTIVTGLGSARKSSMQIPGSFAVPEGVAWSGDGSTAVLYSRSGSWIQVLSGIPSAVNPGAPVSIASLGRLSAVTTDFRGAQIAIAVGGQTSGTYRIANGNFVPLLPLSNPIDLTFSDDGQILYALDGATNSVFAQKMADLTSQSWALSGLADPIAIRAAHDAANRAVVYVAGRSDRLLLEYDASTYQVLANMQLSFQPSVIQPLGSGSFLLASRTTAEDVLWSFRNTPQPSVYFVPAPPVASRESGRK
jgi:hypothetical protein